MTGTANWSSPAMSWSNQGRTVKTFIEHVVKRPVGSQVDARPRACARKHRNVRAGATSGVADQLPA